jgi:hypothetical protein
MKSLSLVTLLAGTFAFGLAAIPTSGTAYAGHRHSACCHNSDCVARALVQYPGASDMIRGVFLSNCLICNYPYNHRRHHEDD